jgi:ABC-2 type transport system permease protein
MTFSRLTLVELRKAVDTRAGLWLQAVVAFLTVVAVGLYARFGGADGQSLEVFLEVAMAPAAVLLPVVGILLVGSEWSQRTALVTFALVPRRLRVLAAKLVAGLLLGAAAFLFCVVVAVCGTALAGASWHLPAVVFAQIALFVLLSMAMGIAFGAAFLSSAAAIALSFVLPLGGTAVGSLTVFRGVARWLDTDRALGPLTDHAMSALEWAHAGTALALWLVVPLLVGLVRISRADVA